MPPSLLPFAALLFSRFPAVLLALGHPSLARDFELPPGESSFTVIEETGDFKFVQVVLRRRGATGVWSESPTGQGRANFQVAQCGGSATAPALRSGGAGASLRRTAQVAGHGGPRRTAGPALGAAHSLAGAGAGARASSSASLMQASTSGSLAQAAAVGRGDAAACPAPDRAGGYASSCGGGGGARQAPRLGSVFHGAREEGSRAATSAVAWASAGPLPQGTAPRGVAAPGSGGAPAWVAPVQVVAAATSAAREAPAPPPVHEDDPSAACCAAAAIVAAAASALDEESVDGVPSRSSLKATGAASPRKTKKKSAGRLGSLKEEANEPASPRSPGSFHPWGAQAPKPRPGVREVPG